MQDSVSIGVDIGGTKISAGIVENGKLTEKHTTPTDALKSRDEVLNNLFHAIEQVIKPGTSSIGIGVPGIINPEKGILHAINNIPEWQELPLAQIVEERFNVKTFINNDANCFALGESVFGQAKEFKNVIGVALGTGLGTGIIVNGKLYGGAENGAGEFGMVPYKGKIFENYTSGQFFKDIKKVDGKETYERAVAGDFAALELWKEFGAHLSEIVLVMTYALSPEAVIFGGSVSAGFDFFIESLKTNLKEKSVLKKVTDNMVFRKTVDPEIAILGAAALAY